MPVYEYIAVSKGCKTCSEPFEVEQSIKDNPLTLCPDCGEEIRRVIHAPLIHTPPTNSKLRNLGFSKLVKRDKGVYENVTRQTNEPKIIRKKD